MVPRRSRSAALICAACAAIALSGVLSGCKGERANDAGREGKVEEIGKLNYNVYITRELNLKDVEDSGYYRGPEAPPGFALYGVFLTVCNPAHSSSTPKRMAA